MNGAVGELPPPEPARYGPTGTARAGDAISRDQLIGLAARYRTSWSLALRQAVQAWSKVARSCRLFDRG